MFRLGLFALLTALLFTDGSTNLYHDWGYGGTAESWSEEGLQGRDIWDQPDGPVAPPPPSTITTSPTPTPMPPPPPPPPPTMEPMTPTGTMVPMTPMPPPQPIIITMEPTGPTPPPDPGPIGPNPGPGGTFGELNFNWNTQVGWNTTFYGNISGGREHESNIILDNGGYIKDKDWLKWGAGFESNPWIVSNIGIRGGLKFGNVGGRRRRRHVGKSV